MSYEICNRCSVRNCRRTPDTGPHGMGECKTHKMVRPKDKMLLRLWEDQPQELMELLSRVKMQVSIGAGNKPRIERKRI